MGCIFTGGEPASGLRRRPLAADAPADRRLACAGVRSRRMLRRTDVRPAPGDAGGRLSDGPTSGLRRRPRRTLRRTGIRHAPAAARGERSGADRRPACAGGRLRRMLRRGQASSLRRRPHALGAEARNGVRLAPGAARGGRFGGTACAGGGSRRTRRLGPASGLRGGRSGASRRRSAPAVAG